MAVKIRLTRIGRHKEPIYRIVVSDSRTARDGKCIEQIGHYDPSKGDSGITINEELALKWLSHGAQPSDTIRTMLKAKGIMKKHADSKISKGK